MNENSRIRDKKTGLIYGDLVDNGDCYFGTRPGETHHVRIPKRRAVDVGPTEMDEPVEEPEIKGGAVMPEDLERVRKERGGKKS